MKSGQQFHLLNYISKQRIEIISVQKVRFRISYSMSANSARTKADTEAVREWIKKQRHLPQKIGENFIMRFLHCCDYSLERTKYLIDLFFTLRSQAPEIFADRDPESPALKNMFELLDMVPLPKMNEKNYKLFLYRITDSDADRFSHADSLKAFFMVADLRILFGQELADGEVPIVDMSKITLRHLTKTSLPILRKYMTYTQEGHPVRLKQIHVINVPPFLDRFHAMIKPFMNSQVAGALHFHQPNSTTLFDYISPDLLPADYGGTLPTVEVLKTEWMDKIRLHRDVFLDEERWRVDESKRPPENINGQQSFGMEGSFRVLNID